MLSFLTHALSAAAASGLFLSAEPASEGRRDLVDRIVAVVNEDVITWSELKTAATPYYEQNPDGARREALHKQILDQLISEKLLSQQVREAKIEVTQEEIDRAMDDILKQHSISKEELRQAVEQRGMSMAQYREDLDHQLVRLKLIDLKVRSRVVVSDNDIKAEYEKQSSLEKHDELITLRHLFFRFGEGSSPSERARVLDRATKGRERLLAGEDFAKVAKEVSEGPTASTGGELGEVGMQGLLPEMAKAVRKMKVGEISGLIETDSGVHVIRIEGTRNKEATGFEQAKNQIYQRLYQAEVERQMKLWVDELKSQSAIENRL
jgi:peptidyl-prolyl cis-trans isomerase SurA